ncbi:MAG: GatB/YqeY domain-containing protein [Bacilli bacterium]|mgnify:CR=1 FL=1|nr:GatB/YqeY domain-containing protein [Bacilli bacterium]
MLDQIKKDLIKYMKEQDKFKLDVIRMLKSAIQMESINLKHDLSDDEILAVIKREVKKRNSSIEEYKKFGKDEVVESLKKEIEVLSVYLPEELNDDELAKIIHDKISKIDSPSIKDMGIIIKEISQEYGAQVDMSKVSKLVKEKLS